MSSEMSMLNAVRFLFVFWISVGFTTISNSLAAGEEIQLLPQQIGTFEGKTAEGKTLKVAPESSKLTAVIVLGTECPLAKLYSQRIQKMFESYQDADVRFIGLMSNSHDSRENILAFIEQHKLTLPIIKDERNRIADKLNATRTPEAVLFDRDGTIRYRGRIDDQFGIGTFRDQPTTQDLKNAIEDVLADREVKVPLTEPVGCLIGRHEAKHPTEQVTYSNQIARLFQKRCNDCHRAGQVAPFALTDYEEVAGWADMIEEVVRQERMPPWHAAPEHGTYKNDCHLTQDEKQLIYDWVAAGAPEGDPKDLPEPKQYPSEWLLPNKPDVVFSITKEPYEVPATGTVKYQYFKVDPHLTEDKWVQASEIRPGNHLVVHHVLAFARPKGGRGGGAGGEEGGFLAAYVPGLVPQPYPPGMAKKLPADSELIFQVHYTPVGSAQLDASQIGLIFADEETVTHQVMTSSATNRNFEIPPGADNHEVKARSPKSDRDVQLLTLMPHMHVRGKSFEYEIHTPGEEPETILSVPRYDFNWQTSYRLAEPVLLPAGTRIHCTAHFDNSVDNPYNPDPEKTVRWGDQTWEEMMIGYFDVAIPLESEGNQQAFGNRAQQLIARLDKNDDGKLSRSEIPLKWLPIFLAVDKNVDGQVTAEELEKAARKAGR